MDFTDGYIYVDYSQMTNAADELVHQTKRISTILVTLEAELNALRNSWVGDDKDVYAEKQKAWNGAVEAMEGILTQHANLLGRISEQYDYSSKSLTQMWESVTIGGR
ncbi:WXG100 family type VII secretion target [Streptomyces sp. NPDC004838]